ncbi:PAC2 family protein [Nocardioides convexus]|uniref:PAC2 family protein n=1 Tax=Nocardioides convexus TaxID=2712224 RepID=UPI00241825A7|nr:PAC2 family protein [Nocardioides convexus]
MTFARDHYEGYDAPRLVVRLLHDHGGAPYLLLHGPEPDIRWEAFCRAVREVVERFRVRLVVSMGSVPMAVPHTRPIAITHHANNPDLLTGTSPWRGEPAGAEQCTGAAGGAAGGVGPRRAGLRRARAALPGAGWTTRAPRSRCWSRSSLAARLTVDLNDLGETRRGPRGGDQPLPRRERRGAGGRHRAGAAVRHLRPRRGGGQQPARRGRAAADRRGDRPPVRAVPRRPGRPRGQRRRT